MREGAEEPWKAGERGAEASERGRSLAETAARSGRRFRSDPSERGSAGAEDPPAKESKVITTEVDRSGSIYRRYKISGIFKYVFKYDVYAASLVSSEIISSGRAGRLGALAPIELLRRIAATRCRP